MAATPRKVVRLSLKSLDPQFRCTPAEEWMLTAGSATVDGVPAGPWSLRVTSADSQVWAGCSGGVETEILLE